MFELVPRHVKGWLIPLALACAATGAAGIHAAAVDNGDAATTEPFRGDRRHAFSGMALVIVSGTRDRPGRITLTAESEGLKPARISLVSERK